MLTGLMSSGVYEIPKIDFHFDCVVTNTTPIGAYRGAGRPEATALVERAIDMFAAEIGMDPAEVRRKNFITDFPHQTVMGANYDSGEYHAALDKCLANAGYDGAARRPGGAARARRRQAARARPVLLRRVDRVRLRARHVHGRGGRHGDRHRGHVLARPGPRDLLRAARRGTLGIPMKDIKVIQSDTEAGQARHGHDGLALAAGRRHGRPERDRRGARQGQAARRAPARGRRRRHRGRARAKAWPWPAHPASAIPWADLARAAADPARRPEGFEGGLSSENDFETPDATYPFGTHLAVVEVDTETGHGGPRPAHHRRRRGPDREPDARRGPGARRHRAGRRAGAVRGDRVRRGRQQRHRQPGVLRDPVRGRPAELRDRAHADADAAQPAGREGHRRGGRDRRDAGGLERGRSTRSSHMGVRNIDMPATPQRVWRAINEASSVSTS